MTATLQEPRTTHPRGSQPGVGHRAELVKSLNQRLADAIDLQLQAKHAHWNVKGPSFSALHELFEQAAVEVAQHADLIAERAVQLGGVAEGVVPVVAKRSDLPQYPARIASGADHVTALAKTLATFGAKIRPGITEAEQAGDLVTADILTEVARGIDKLRWLIEAHAHTELSEEARP
jgi:starvation-inducible DNA-binding protein